ncbi:MAG TPA: chlorite dismutase family protein [Longimicrobiales bacterium]|nr:chlorite dismutase family protein [Longimicrobiales bacterium]
MEEQHQAEPVVLGHFACYRFTPAFWALDSEQRRTRAGVWLAGVQASADACHLYLTQGIETGADILLWSSVRAPGRDAPGSFFRERASVENAHRDILDPGHVLWGLTRPSEYSRAAKSAQEIDPFAPQRLPYLVMYPFTKTADWYLKGRETRQGMMNEHIRIGKQYRDITQLLLYSFGLQDQEFVVVYETDDLSLFSKLVHDLRDTEARRYTKADTPLHTGVRVTRDTWLSTLG